MARASQKENYIVKTLNGMAYGFFASLIIGTILKQIGGAIHWGDLIYWGQLATYLMGPAIGVGIAVVLDAKGLNMIAAVIAGAIGAGTFSISGQNVSVAVGNPVSAYLAVILAIEVTKLIQDKTPLDILLVPLTSILCAGLITKFVGPYISQVIVWIGDLINQGVTMQPLLMGMIVAVLMGMALTAPISSAAIGIMLGLNGLAAGAALAGCCAQMVGLAIMSMDDNQIGDVIAIGIGTSMLQFKNIVKRPIIWLPPIVASLITGILSTAVLGIKCTPVGSGMGTAGLVGLLECIQVMGSSFWLPLIIVDVLVPMAICWSMYRAFRKLNYIKSGDMKLTRL
ncbi:PTS transporter subunit IIC [Candidatus Stoquefichus sp. SB1]|uniref:PTS transporter subunit IIC n=1 Tax=Candidatus Stoquefichus sp. SB1 TaxID=1658109 RepID=UPI00067EC115|nr:PTS sugar transporter subunit IIC [Candidatus Stoquefichus sp. SB1]